MPDFENHDFKIASGLRKILTGNFHKRVTTAEGKAQPEKITYRQTDRLDGLRLLQYLWRNQAILDFRDLTAVTDRPTDSMLETLYKMQVAKSEELNYLLQVYAPETTLGDEKYDYCRLKVMVQRHLEQKIRDSHCKARNRHEDRPALGTSSKGKAKGNGKQQAKTDSRRGDCIRWTTKGRCSFGEACAFKHDRNKKGKGNGRPRSPSPTGSPHRISKGDGMGGADGGATSTPNLHPQKSVRKSGQTTLCKLQERELPKREIHVTIGMFPNVCLQIKAPSGCRLGDKCAYNTHSNTC